MPTYAYACTACGHAFEIVQSFSDDSLSVCPECEGRLRKVFSSVGVRLQGLWLLPQRRPRRREVVVVAARGHHPRRDPGPVGARVRARRVVVHRRRHRRQAGRVRLIRTEPSAPLTPR